MVGIDIVDVGRLREALARSPKLALRLFTVAEMSYASARQDPCLHLAGTLAAKEATVKALGLSSLAKWTKTIEVSRDDTGKPRARLMGDNGGPKVTLSISHDGGLATAVAIAGESASEERKSLEAKPRRIPALVFTPQVELCLAETWQTSVCTRT